MKQLINYIFRLSLLFVFNNVYSETYQCDGNYICLGVLCIIEENGDYRHFDQYFFKNTIDIVENDSIITINNHGSTYFKTLSLEKINDYMFYNKTYSNGLFYDLSGVPHRMDIESKYNFNNSKKHLSISKKRNYQIKANWNMQVISIEMKCNKKI